MKKKILCGIFFLMVLFCISFSQTHLTAADFPGAQPTPGDSPGAGPSAGDTSGAGSSSDGTSGTDPSSQDASGAEAGALPESGDGSDVLSGAAPDVPSGEPVGFETSRESGRIPSTQNTDAVLSAEQLAAEMDNTPAPQINLPGLPSGATPEPLANTAAADGQYILSLTTSIGTLTYYNQSDSRWANYLYGGSDPLSVYGCGPTVLAMLVTSFTENTCQPPDMAAWAAANHYWSLGSGTKHEFIPEGAAAFGLKAESFRNLTAEGVISELKNGHILVALMGPGHFSDSGHFIIIIDDWTGNQVRVADPARLERTQTAWDVQVILDELLLGAKAGGPVWSITPK